MLKKLHIALFLCLLGFQISCKTEQTRATSQNTQTKLQEDNSDDEIRKLFIEFEGKQNDLNLAKLETLPKERFIKVVKEIRKNGIPYDYMDSQSEIHNAYVKLKSAYYLFELGIDKTENEQYILQKAKVETPAKAYEKDLAVFFIGKLIANGKKEFFPIVFAAIPTLEGQPANTGYEIIHNEIERSPNVFLQYLSNETLETRKSIYKMMREMKNLYSKDVWKKLISSIRNVVDDKEVEKTAKELLKEVNS